MPVIWYTLTFYCVLDSQPEKNNLSLLFIGALNTFWFLPFKVCLQWRLELTYLSLLSVLWDQTLFFTYFCSLMIVPCFHLWFPWGSCMEYAVTLGVSGSSLSAQVLWHKQIEQEDSGLFQSDREQCCNICNRRKTDQLSNTSKDTRNCPMRFSMKVGMVQNTSVINYVILY